MSNFLRQATASQARAIGPFLDDTDFKTPETGLTIANTDIKLVVNGGASANKNSGGGTHRVNGMFGLTFDATDTATVGEMEVSVVVGGALPVFKTFYVLEEAVFDALFAASAPGYVANAPVNVAQFGGSNGTFSGGRPEVNTSHAAGTAWNSGAIGASTLASDTITAAKIATDAGAEIADAIHDEVVEGSTTLRQILRGFASALLGKASGLATTSAKYRDLADSKDRITATVDADGNRTAITLDLT